MEALGLSPPLLLHVLPRSYLEKMQCFPCPKNLLKVVRESRGSGVPFTANQYEDTGNLHLHTTYTDASGMALALTDLLLCSPDYRASKWRL